MSSEPKNSGGPAARGHGDPSSAPKEAKAPEAPGGVITLNYLIRNLISLMGLFGMLCFGLAIFVRIGLDLSGLAAEGAYSGLVTYIVLPAFFTASVAFTGLGMFLKWLRTRRFGPQLSLVPGRTVARRYAAVAVAAGVTAGWLLLSLYGTYRAYQYTDSNTFCGLACHQVMEPEYTAYRASPHARVHCVGCHIGPGADWFVKSKISGMRQLWAVAVKSYRTPIATPVHDLRPAQDTCEQCHWPGRFSGAVERVITHYAKDDENTPTRYRLLMKVGGGHASLAQPGGAHWHVSGDWTVHYLPLDQKRQDIPFVRVTYRDGRVEEFLSPGFDRSKLDEGRLRTMDCIDCHNRPTHIFKSPDRALNEALDNGRLSPLLPAIKKTAMELLSAKYATRAEALAALDAGLDEYARGRKLTPEQDKSLAAARESLKSIYSANFFPQHGVDYRAFVDNAGHYEFRGCERCHDGKHKLTGGAKVISHGCDNCHLIVGQAGGVKEVAEMKYEVRPFEHPENPVNLKKTCSSCHALDKDGK